MASNPDNWCHLQETMNMLQLTSAQIHTSILDGENSVSELTQTLEAIAEKGQELEHLLEQDTNLAKMQTNAMMQDVNRGVRACQFHDRVSQRLNHVTESINELANIITHPEDFSDEDKWQQLQQSIRENYTMDCERLMFEQIMMDRTVEEALELYKHHFDEATDDPDDVELF